eukprot:96005-Amphidinium_carterae.1
MASDLQLQAFLQYRSARTLQPFVNEPLTVCCYTYHLQHRVCLERIHRTNETTKHLRLTTRHGNKSWENMA